MSRPCETLEPSFNEGCVARLTLARPALHEPISLELIREIRRAVGEIEAGAQGGPREERARAEELVSP
jgi:enoyl-CoA hydratase/carnithine racemase